MTRILIVEDDTILSRLVVNWLKDAGIAADSVTTIREAFTRLKRTDYDLILCDLRLPDGCGIKILDWINENGKRIPFIIMTKYGDVPTAVDAVKKGAYEFIEKPVHDIPLIETIQKANYDLSVMIRGESGAGKEHIAHILHENSARRNKPFVKVDCGTITKELAASIFFGHEKGAYTGADANATGLFREAEGGTLYFDEIGNLPVEAQRVLLRVLQERQYMPLGGTKEVSCDVRVIAATNEDIEKAVDEGRFRFDLWQRVDEYTLEVPSLNECPEDVMPLAEELLKRFNGELHKNVQGFSDDAKEKLHSHCWPGNVRELKNVIRCALVENTGGWIEAVHLKFKPVPRQGQVLTLKDDEEDRRKIEQALEKANGNVSKAADILHISRPTLYKKMDDFGLR